MAAPAPVDHARCGTPDDRTRSTGMTLVYRRCPPATFCYRYCPHVLSAPGPACVLADRAADMCILRMYGGAVWLPRLQGVGRVLSSAKISTGSWRYYTAGVACRASDYYLGVGEAPGRWHGRGLEQLGLSRGLGGRRSGSSRRCSPAACTRAPADRLGRAWRSDGVTGFDLTFSAPKSVSALWALGDSTTAAEGMAAHRAAVRAGLAYLDNARRAVASRDRRGRADRLSGLGGGGVRPSQQPGRGPAAAHPRAGAEQGPMRRRSVAHAGCHRVVPPQEERRNDLPSRIAQRNAATPWCAVSGP